MKYTRNRSLIKANRKRKIKEVLSSLFTPNQPQVSPPPKFYRLVDPTRTY